MNKYRTHTCGQLRLSDAGKVVRLAGWLQKCRNHGGLVFLDLRDFHGVTQLIVSCDAIELIDIVSDINLESVITVTGVVQERSRDNINEGLDTGEIEVRLQSCEVISAAEDLPMPVIGGDSYPEHIRLEHRYLDLRREKMQHNIKLRSRVIAFLRQEMHRLGFWDLQTPILTASSPEGARDFVVPSRLHPGKFYALPQAPQQFKQLYMISGFERYFQIAPCFRDEDSRADRSPGDFYQLDVEISFVEQKEILQVTELVMTNTLKEFSDEEVLTPFPIFTFEESMRKYGTDKPDLRYTAVIVPVEEIFANTNFGMFFQVLNSGGKILSIAVPEAGERPRSVFDDLNEWMRKQGAPGLGYILLKNGEVRGSLSKNLSGEEIQNLRHKLSLKEGSCVFFVCGDVGEVYTWAGLARVKISQEFGMYRGGMHCCWITDFPMYVVDEKTGKLQFAHNPFSLPQGGLLALQSENPLNILSHQYDLVCNGIELGSGAMRNYCPKTMLKAFSLIGYSSNQVKRDFRALYNALLYGAPPHGGIAPGIDRIVMLLAKEENIRSVIAFPLNQCAVDNLMGAPTNILPQHLRDLHLKITYRKD